jgi:hypothetical protein
MPWLPRYGLSVLALIESPFPAFVESHQFNVPSLKSSQFRAIGGLVVLVLVDVDVDDVLVDVLLVEVDVDDVLVDVLLVDVVLVLVDVVVVVVVVVVGQSLVSSS